MGLLGELMVGALDRGVFGVIVVDSVVLGGGVDVLRERSVLGLLLQLLVEETKEATVVVVEVVDQLVGIPRASRVRV